MVLKQHVETKPKVRWIGGKDIDSSDIPSLAYKITTFYKKCILGPLTLSVGDYILVSNIDAAEPDSVSGCDVARILYLFEQHDLSSKDPFRAIVQWYSNPQCIPHKFYDDDEINIDFNYEIIEEYRPFDPDISIEAIFQKCYVTCGQSRDNPSILLEMLKNKVKSTLPMFVCRYKFIKVKKSYRLVPLEFSTEIKEKEKEKNKLKHLEELYLEEENSKLSSKPRKGSLSARKPSRFSSINGKRRASVSAASAVEFVDVDYFNENKVSPIKIIGGNSVVRLSGSAKSSKDVIQSYVPTSPLCERNVRSSPYSASKAAAAKRNLNLSLEKAADSTADSDCLNYSIVKTDAPNEKCTNDMIIKLRISDRRRSTRLLSTEDPLAIVTNKEDLPVQNERKRILNENVLLSKNETQVTPSKKPKDSENVSCSTPSTLRKSILKSATKKIADGTPRRSIQLSSIVEKRIYNDTDEISTPKRSRVLKTDEPTEKNSTQTPTRARRTLLKSHFDDEPLPMTPTQKLRRIRSGEVSAGIEKRQLQKGQHCKKTDIQLAREQLHVSAVPVNLPCREKEFHDISTFLEGKIQDQCGGCMYVSGVPGTGKTATVTRVIRMLQQKAVDDEIPSFEFLEINGMRLTEPRQAYVQIYKQLTGKTVSWEQAHSLLEKRFTTPAPRRATTVLLIDELDILCNRRQDVVYNLLDWPTKSAARLVVVTIANTMDLPERLLMGKVTSRLGLTRLTFQPYSYKQLQEIVVSRLTSSDTFKSDAVQLVARKVAAVSGDARRALDICRRATEIADTSDEKEKCVKITHVQQALTEMIASAKVQAIKNCSRMEQVFLQAVAAESTRTGLEETTFINVYSQIETIATFMGILAPPPGGALRICSKLGSQRLLIGEHSRNDIFQKILLNVSMDDIHYALRVNNNS